MLPDRLGVGGGSQRSEFSSWFSVRAKRFWSAMRPRIALKDAGARFFKSDAVGRVSAVTTDVEIPDNRERDDK
jgi:hypothetical protein